MASLKEKGQKDETQKLQLLKALNAKRRYEALQEECSPESFLDRAFEASEALKLVAEKMSPRSNRELLAATFTPKMTTLKAYNIPRTKVPSSERTSPTLLWQNSNFPVPSHKVSYTIGCANAP